METHIKHARQWGYPTHISKHDPSGNSGQIRLVLEKALHVLSMLMSEAVKASHERATGWCEHLNPPEMRHLRSTKFPKVSACSDLSSLRWFDAETIIIKHPMEGVSAAGRSLFRYPFNR